VAVSIQIDAPSPQRRGTAPTFHWMGPTAGLEDQQKEKSPTLARIRTLVPRFSNLYPRHYTD